MRKMAFSVYILGMFVLISFFWQRPVPVSGESLSEFVINTRVVFSGEVVSERVIYPGTKLMKIKNYDVICKCEDSFYKKVVRVVGKVEEYKGERQVIAEEIILGIP